MGGNQAGKLEWWGGPNKVHVKHSINTVNNIILPVGPPNNNNIAIVDTGATGHFLTPEAACPISVWLPDGWRIVSTHTARLQIQGINVKGQETHVLPNLHDNNLVLVGQLCDQGCTATFTKNKSVTVTLDGTPKRGRGRPKKK